jgi:hypothetical protein
MMSNIDFIIQNYAGLLNYPILVSIAPILIGSLIYIFGKIRVSNHWQYHLDNKYVPFLHGIVVINNFVFIPLVIITFFYYILFDSINLLSPNFISMVGLIIVLNIVQTLGKQLIKWKKQNIPENTEKKLIYNFNLIIEILNNWKEYFKLILLKGVFPIILYLSIFFVLKYSYNRIILLFVGFVWLLAMMFFSTVDTITEQHKTYEIVLKNKKILKNTKIIEFLNDGKLIKFQEENLSVKVIPVENISEIILSKGGK